MYKIRLPFQFLHSSRVRSASKKNDDSGPKQVYRSNGFRFTLNRSIFARAWYIFCHLVYECEAVWPWHSHNLHFFVCWNNIYDFQHRIVLVKSVCIWKSLNKWFIDSLQRFDQNLILEQIIWAHWNLRDNYIHNLGACQRIWNHKKSAISRLWYNLFINVLGTFELIGSWSETWELASGLRLMQRNFF